MATNYPGSLDTGTEQPSPLSTTEMDDAGFEHDVVHANHSGAIIALETKVGIGSSTAVADSVLAGTGAGTSGWSTAPSLAGLTVDTDTLYVDATNDRVGIGTTTPASLLEVSSATGTTPTSPTEIRISTSTNGGSWSTTAPWGQLSFYSADSSNGGAKVQAAVATTPVESFGGLGRLGLWTNDSTGLYERLSITNAGNVGIGTTTPGYKLDVNGNLRSQSYVVIESGLNDKLQLTANTTGNRPFLSINNWNGSAYVRRGYIGYPTAGSATANINIVADNGDVNISPELTINSGPKLSDPSSANQLRVTTAYGYLDLGPQNSTYCHVYTDRAQFYTNKGFNSVPFLYWRNNSGIGGPLTDTSSTSGYRYVLQNQTYGTFFDYTSVRDRKEQITNVTAEDSGRWIDALQPVTYIERWMGEGDEPDDARAWREADMQVGFIADDILANSDTDHFSQVIDNGEGGLDPAGWKWECMIAAAVAEIKSLRARVAELEAA